MKAMLAGFIAVFVIGAGSNFLLRDAGFSTQERTTVGHSVRLDD